MEGCGRLAGEINASDYADPNVWWPMHMHLPCSHTCNVSCCYHTSVRAHATKRCSQKAWRRTRCSVWLPTSARKAFLCIWLAFLCFEQAWTPSPSHYVRPSEFVVLQWVRQQEINLKIRGLFLIMNCSCIGCPLIEHLRPDKELEAMLRNLSDRQLQACVCHWFIFDPGLCKFWVILTLPDTGDALSIAR